MAVIQIPMTLGIFPIPGNFGHKLGWLFGLWEIPKTHWSLGILTSGAKIDVKAPKQWGQCKISGIWAFHGPLEKKLIQKFPEWSYYLRFSLM